MKVKKSFKGNSSSFTWTCDGKPEKQVKYAPKYAPKGGIETGFGATAA